MMTGVQETITDLAGTVGTAVVGVGRRRHVGSGIVIDKGTVLTNAHNIHSRQVTVTFADGRSATGDVKGVDTDGDIAVVAVDTQEVTPVVWSTNEADLGSPVVGLSNPGGRGLRVTVGYVSSVDRSFRGPRGRRISGSIEHTAPLLPGSSGGPIVDEAGKLLGINTNRLGEGFYLAIAADAGLRSRTDKLAAGEAPQRHYLGVSVVPGFVARKMRRAVGLPDTNGVLVRGVADDGPAAAAGITEGEMIVKVGDLDIAEVDDLHDALDAATAGEPIAVTVLRGIDEIELTVVLPKA
ncbi:MAG: S1C family serine protease [Actinomycetota bacterium]|nr:S1C family serine protease [Actinomycetota bacterium]